MDPCRVRAERLPWTPSSTATREAQLFICSCKRFHVCCCLNKGFFLRVRKEPAPNVGCNPVQVLHSVQASSLHSVPSETDSILSLSSPC